MLFQAGRSNERYKVLERFYRFDEGLIQRFYGAELSHVDRARLTIGKPPVPLLAALKCISEAETLRRWEN
jgi:lycopene beta-cyclase